MGSPCHRGPYWPTQQDERKQDTFGNGITMPQKTILAQWKQHMLISSSYQVDPEVDRRWCTPLQAYHQQNRLLVNTTFSPGPSRTGTLCLHHPAGMCPIPCHHKTCPMTQAVALCKSLPLTNVGRRRALNSNLHFFLVLVIAHTSCMIYLFMDFCDTTSIRTSAEAWTE